MLFLGVVGRIARQYSATAGEIGRLPSEFLAGRGFDRRSPTSHSAVFRPRSLRKAPARTASLPMRLGNRCGFPKGPHGVRYRPQGRRDRGSGSQSPAWSGLRAWVENCSWFNSARARSHFQENGTEGGTCADRHGETIHSGLRNPCGDGRQPDPGSARSRNAAPNSAVEQVAVPTLPTTTAAARLARRQAVSKFPPTARVKAIVPATVSPAPVTS